MFKPCNAAKIMTEVRRRWWLYLVLITIAAGTTTTFITRRTSSYMVAPFAHSISLTSATSPAMRVKLPRQILISSGRCGDWAVRIEIVEPNVYANEPFSLRAVVVTDPPWHRSREPHLSSGTKCAYKTSIESATSGVTITPTHLRNLITADGSELLWIATVQHPGPASIALELVSPESESYTLPLEFHVIANRRITAGTQAVADYLWGLRVSAVPEGSKTGHHEAVQLNMHGAATETPPGLSPVLRLHVCAYGIGAAEPTEKCFDEIADLRINWHSSINSDLYLREEGIFDIGVRVSAQGSIDGVQQELITRTLHSGNRGRSHLATADRVYRSLVSITAILGSLGGIAGLALVVAGIRWILARSSRAGHNNDAGVASNRTDRDAGYL
jgi:hypothetical protein